MMQVPFNPSLKYGLFALLLFAGTALPAKPINKTLFGGLAIDGYDSVAYFTMGRAVKGKSEFSYKWQGAVWRFVNQRHLDMFKKNPSRYAPQYGGYCAYAMSQNSKYTIDPHVWSIVQGKLYLNYDRDVQKKWNKKRDAYIRQADKYWKNY